LTTHRSRRRDQSATPRGVLDEIESASPFESDGTIRPPIAEGLLTLDARSLGRAVTGLIRGAIRLSAAESERAATAIAEQLTAWSQHQLSVELEVAALVRLYRELLGDPSRRPIAKLVATLLQSVDRRTVFASVGTDAASLRLRAALTIDLGGQGARKNSGLAAQPTGHIRTTRGMGGAVARDVQVSDEIDLDQLDEPRAEPPSPNDERGLPVTPAIGPAARTYRAYGLLACDETVLVGRPFVLDLGLSRAPQIGVAGAPLTIPLPDAQPYELDVQLFADGFDLAPGEAWRHSLNVATDDLYPSVSLHLSARAIAESPMDRTITATFAIAGELLGTATRHVVVVTDARSLPVDVPAPTATGASVGAPSGLPPADITITIQEGDERGKFVWGVESKLPAVALPPGRPPDSDIGKEPEAFMQWIIRRLFVQGHQAGLFTLLQGIGEIIHDAMPREVRSALAAANAAVAPRPLDVLLLTQEPYVPWELAWVDEPFDPAAPHYLGAQANIGRWVLDDDIRPDPPRRVDASAMAVVWGVYQSAGLGRLVAAEEEAAQIQARYHAVSVDARPDGVINLLDGLPPADILHFAVHGKYNPNGVDEGIYLVEGPPIDQATIRGSDLSERAPFVFLNACQVGAAQNLLGSYAGIAQAFLKVGASAVVAPLWSVDDTIAQQIALEFYERALQPAPDAGGADGAGHEAPTVAALLRRIRAELVTNVADPSATYLAYQFYGHPSLRLSWKQAAGEGDRTGGPGDG
jgi:hypothetical protein